MKNNNHPAPWLPLLLKYTATTTGRDKVYRFIQYLGKFAAYRLATLDPKGNKDQVDKITKLVKHLSLSRKLMRIGRPLEYAQNLIAGVPTTKDPVLLYSLIAKNGLLAIWMGFDFLAWAQGVGIWKSADPKALSQNTNRFWFAGLAAGYIATVYNVHVLAVLEKAKREGAAMSEDQGKEAKALLASRNKLLRDLFQQSLDILVPAKGLELISLSDGVIGLTGALTSLMGAQAQWGKVNSSSK
ncbi:peroxisomal biogenesis factor 11 [Blastocladiella britannica]|nr:peroxisomal biogenesis factor 11 [Blastocladiella britannica]